MLLAQDFVALLERLPKDLIGVALAAIGGYFLWLKITAYIDQRMEIERARCDAEMATLRSDGVGRMDELRQGQGELKAKLRGMNVWRELAWWLRVECIRLGAPETDIEQRWPKEDQ